MNFVEGLQQWIDKYAELALNKGVVTGKIRFVGKTKFKFGNRQDIWVGVQLDNPEGQHNGTV